MVKRKEITETHLEGQADGVDAVLARIAKFKKITETLKSTAVDSKRHPDDIYFLDVKHPELSHTTWKRYHGKCLKAGFAQLADWGYVYTVTDQISTDNKARSKTTCEHCNKELNPQLAKEVDKESKERYEKMRTDFELKQKIQNAREEEMVLLGLM